MERERSVSAAGLHDWGMGDQPGREDFNGNRRILEEAIAGKCAIVTGNYIGDGTHLRTVTLGFTPKAVLVEHKDGFRSFQENVAQYGGLLQPGFETRVGGIIEGGFKLKELTLNYPDYTYFYLAVR